MNKTLGTIYLIWIVLRAFKLQSVSCLNLTFQIKQRNVHVHLSYEDLTQCKANLISRYQ